MHDKIEETTRDKPLPKKPTTVPFITSKSRGSFCKVMRVAALAVRIRNERDGKRNQIEFGRERG